MKRLNRKGFTLIELLAVVVIMAIILVVTIPSVLNTMADARYKQLQNAANSVQEWFVKQRELNIIGQSLSGTDTADSAYTTYANKKFTISSADKYFKNGDVVPLDEAVLKAAGIANPGTNFNYTATGVTTGTHSTAKLTGNKVCIRLVAKPGGNFYNATDTSKNSVASSGC